MKLALGGGAMAALLGSYPVLVERNIVLVNRYAVPVTNLPSQFHGFTLAHLTDLHLGLVSESFLEGIVRRTNRLRADATACTGDFVHHRDRAEEVEKVWPILSKLEARYGVYSVLGNHDHWADSERSLYWLERSGQSLRHISKPIYRGKERIVLGGAGDYWEDDLNIDQAFLSSDETDCRILLAHNPDSVDTDFSTPVSLVISGHTHGGQVVVPYYGAPVLPVKNKAYSSGLIPTPKTQLFISRGLGWAILPVRFNCYPEIALLELLNPAMLA